MAPTQDPGRSGAGADLEEATEHYKRALALAVDLELAAHAARIHLDLGMLHRRTGDRTRARDHLTTALAMYRELDTPFWVAKVEAETAQLTDRR